MDFAHERVHALTGRSRLACVHLDVRQIEVDGRAGGHHLEGQFLDQLCKLRRRSAGAHVGEPAELLEELRRLEDVGLVGANPLDSGVLFNTYFKGNEVK